MCGLIGIAATQSIRDFAWLIVGRDAMIHRGPDDAGEWWSEDGSVGLAHRRLAIVDLSTTGHQPMGDVTGTLNIVFNGEIYNFMELRKDLVGKGYTFSSHSDTEVILAAYREWGTNCLRYLNGMFAIAIYDARERTLFLARDRAGEKPLFYHQSNGVMRFASELKALLADPTLPRLIEPEALDCYLAAGYVPGDRCILQGFKKLPPAHALEFDLRTGKSKIWRYWQLPEFNASMSQREFCETALLDELESLLEKAVRRQLVADVPVGVLLSGGVDSSLITAMAVRATNKVQTFTIGFPSHAKQDESEHARLISQHFGTQHTELMAEPATADLLPLLARQFDEPMSDSSMIPTFLVSRLVRQECKVALGGDGGDELFGGYGYYSRLAWMSNHLSSIPRSLRRLISLAAERLLPLGFAGNNIRTWLMAMGTDLEHGLPHYSSCFDVISRGTLLGAKRCWPPQAQEILEEFVPAGYDIVQRATRMEFATYLSEDLLVKVDRASMLNSLEVRAPLLDCNLIEFAFGKVPSHLKATEKDKKVLLKRLVARVLPPAFDRKRKQGFSIPIEEWLKGGPFRSLFNDVLRDPQSCFDQRAVDALLSGQDRGRFNGERLFTLVLFELWRRQYAATF